MKNSLNEVIIEIFVGLCQNGVVIYNGDNEPMIFENFNFNSENNKIKIKNIDNDEELIIENIDSCKVEDHDDYIYIVFADTKIMIEELAI
ncbi:hypothetical protein [Clostridium tagluense]|uniref:Uncharacterized protein n=1 Tax=Clostridium tagluense TaxID=360422 RepID=A0A401UTJ2_9CLOT|nr:hypothetical protein [Clostridium tagluense]GCD12879.1 hypothetical protein Ctaglu_45020 [Clostridium tagluense]